MTAWRQAIDLSIEDEDVGRLVASRAAASAINDSRKAMATATAHRGSVTQTPSIWSKACKPFGNACDTISAMSALAAR